MLQGMNRYALRAKWTRKARKHKLPSAKPVLAQRSDDIPVSFSQYHITLLHLARCWNKQMYIEMEWFLKSMRGELPERLDASKCFHVHYIFLPREQYMLALEALTTKLGVRLPA